VLTSAWPQQLGAVKKLKHLDQLVKAFTGIEQKAAQPELRVDSVNAGDDAAARDSSNLASLRKMMGQ
jgi:hypothetical protein